MSRSATWSPGVQSKRQQRCGRRVDCTQNRSQQAISRPWKAKVSRKRKGAVSVTFHRVVTAEGVDRPAVEVDAVQRRRLALHDCAASRVPLDGHVMRRHGRDDRLDLSPIVAPSTWRFSPGIPVSIRRTVMSVLTFARIGCVASGNATGARRGRPGLFSGAAWAAW